MSQQVALSDRDVVQFLRKRDYRFVRELGGGACGRTVLLHDDMIDESFVCKKYTPYLESRLEELFKAFTREIKLLHKLHHDNVVRVFNYYLYPEQFSGYILMEHIEGLDIEDFVSTKPESANNIFLQTINGFAYLESQSILHRDIRPNNIMVRADGIVKVIDLGFGKQVQAPDDFNKSITLNWWCSTPGEFSESRYTFATEVYFVGKLFEKILSDNQISHFKYTSTLGRMCQHDEHNRVLSFADVEKEIRNDQFLDFDFSEQELEAYRNFADCLCGAIIKIENGCKYIEDVNKITHQLEAAYRNVMLESVVSDASIIIRCFLNGGYYYNKRLGLYVCNIKEFLRLMKSATEEKRRLIIANLHTRLDGLARYSTPAIDEDDIPF